MHDHGLRSFLLVFVISPVTALTLIFPESWLPQGQSVIVHWALDGNPTPPSFRLRLKEIEPTARIIDAQTVSKNGFGGDVTFDTGILEPGEYVAEARTDDSDHTKLGSSSTLTVVVPPASTKTRHTSNGVTSSTTTTTPGSVSSPNPKLGSTSSSASGLTSIPAHTLQATSSTARTNNSTTPALFPTLPSLSDQLQSSELQPSSTSSIDSTPTEPPVTASSPKKRFDTLPVVVAVVLGLVVFLGVILIIIRRRRKRRSSLDTAPEQLPPVIDRRISDSSFGNASRSRASQSLTVSLAPVSGWPPDEKVPLNLLINALAPAGASGASSATQLNSSSDRHETPPEQTSTANAASPVTTSPSLVLTLPASTLPSAAEHERLLAEIQWWRSQFASWATVDDTDGATAPPSYRGSVAGGVV